MRRGRLFGRFNKIMAFSNWYDRSKNGRPPGRENQFKIGRILDRWRVRSKRSGFRFEDDETRRRSPNRNA